MPRKTPKTTATFALIDVKTGRKLLREVVSDHRLRVPVTLKGYILGDWSGDDGTSIEFEIAITSHKLGKPVKQDCPCPRCTLRAA